MPVAVFFQFVILQQNLTRENVMVNPGHHAITNTKTSIEFSLDLGPVKLSYGLFRLIEIFTDLKDFRLSGIADGEINLVVFLGPYFDGTG